MNVLSRSWLFGGHEYTTSITARFWLRDESRNLRRDMVLARRHQAPRQFFRSSLPTCRTCSGGGRVANVGTKNASARVICQDCHGSGSGRVEFR